MRAIGDQAGGRLFLFLQTDDLTRDYAAHLARGVRFTEEPRFKTYGKRWDLIEPATVTSPAAERPRTRA